MFDNNIGAKVPTHSAIERDSRWDIGCKIMHEQRHKALIFFEYREGALPAPYANPCRRDGPRLASKRNCVRAWSFRSSPVARWIDASSTLAAPL